MPPNQKPVFLTAEWRKLLMMQYPVPPEILAPYLPQGVELDLWQGRPYVSLVGFMFDRVRVKGIPIPFHTRFEEVNLRFYVKRTEPGGEVRRGVVFINEFVPRFAIAFIAKQLYEEPYASMPMRHTISPTPAALHIEYAWNRGHRWHSMSAEADATPKPIDPESFEEFITEHYWGYTKRSNGSTSVYQVEHPRWEMYPVRSWRLDLDYATMYGPQWRFLNDTPIEHALLAEGAPVTVRAGQKLT